ncbi:MAG: hypothetical protein ACI837_002890 [Crocinitomicaceae bacterium]|jgi:hypothetical protein
MKFTTEKDKYVIFTLAIVLVSLTGLLSKDVSGISERLLVVGLLNVGPHLFYWFLSRGPRMQLSGMDTKSSIYNTAKIILKLLAVFFIVMGISIIAFGIVSAIGLSDFGKLGAVSIGLTLLFAGINIHEYLKNRI